MEHSQQTQVHTQLQVAQEGQELQIQEDLEEQVAQVQQVIQTEL
jgi:hypothetical protein